MVYVIVEVDKDDVGEIVGRLLGGNHKISVVNSLQAACGCGVPSESGSSPLSLLPDAPTPSNNKRSAESPLSCSDGCPDTRRVAIDESADDDASSSTSSRPGVITKKIPRPPPDVANNDTLRAAYQSLMADSPLIGLMNDRSMLESFMKSIQRKPGPQISREEKRRRARANEEKREEDRERLRQEKERANLEEQLKKGIVPLAPVYIPPEIPLAIPMPKLPIFAGMKTEPITTADDYLSEEALAKISDHIALALGSTNSAGETVRNAPNNGVPYNVKWKEKEKDDDDDNEENYDGGSGEEYKEGELMAIRCKLCDRVVSLGTRPGNHSTRTYAHARTHGFRDRYQCNLCLTVFQYKKIIVRHNTTVHFNSPNFEIIDRWSEEQQRLLVQMVKKCFPKSNRPFPKRLLFAGPFTTSTVGDATSTTSSEALKIADDGAIEDE